MPDLKPAYSNQDQYPTSALPFSLPSRQTTLTEIEFQDKITQLVPGIIAVYNLKTGNYIYVNDSLTKILGYPKNSFLKGGLNFVTSLIHPDDIKMLLEKNNLAIQKANSRKASKDQTNPIVTFEYRIKHKNGSWHWLHTTGVVFSRNTAGKIECLMNISIDISRRKNQELREIKRRKIIAENLQKSKARFQALLEKSSDGITLLDKTGQRIYASPSRKNILGYGIGQDFGQSVFDYICPEDKPQVYTLFQNLLAKPNKSLTAVFRVRHQTGRWIWIEATGTNLFHIPEINAMVVNYRDVTIRKEIEAKAQFLEKATNILISSIDYETTIKNIARLIVPTLADYCRIAVIEEGGQIKEVRLNHVDPKKISLVKKLYQEYKNKAGMTYGINKILQTGKSEIIPQITAQVLVPVQNDPKILGTLKQLQIKSYMGVPLKARGKTIGAMTFSSTKEGFSYTKENLNLAEELAYRVALALDNARLYTNEQKAVKLRDQFISMASHELKTPITSIKGFVQILQTYQFNGAINHYLARLDEQMTRLTGLINDLLDVSKIQRGKLELNKESCLLNQFLQEIIGDIQPMSENHIITLKSNQEIKIWVDKYRLNQVIINLLTNAIKYSPKSRQVIVEVKVVDQNVHISVQDFGIGILTKNLERIFDPFYQAENRVRQSFGGLGLGLHISQEIIKRHEGEILVQSQKGQGSTFTVVLPLK